ncbi:MAG: HAD-IC family P-type ATPase, partial [Candidatus ainarchaeum sp.]|nr:HAD-IC family P-type ATPase [Candidatus ainarchaeum sp.]
MKTNLDKIISNKLQKETFHNKSAQSTIATLQSNEENGLSKQIVKERLLEFGLNEIESGKKITIYEIFINQFKSILVFALVLTTLISLAMQEYLEALIIFIVIFSNSVVGTIQEFKAEKSMEALKKLSASHARVIRNGIQELIIAKELVVGDIIILETGDKVPADARIIKESNLAVDESMLTGESVPSKKNENVINLNTTIIQRKNMVFKDTIVTNGKAKCIVTATGKNTEIGNIAHLLAKSTEEETLLQKKLNQFMKNIGIVVVIGTIMTIIFGALFTEIEFIDLLKLAIAQAVSFIPEGLPIVITIVLALTVSQMVLKKAIVRKLPAIETLGMISYICTDKTGTLTRNEMTVTQVFIDNQIVQVTGNGYDTIGEFKIENKINPVQNKTLIHLLRTAVLCNDSNIEKKEKNKIIGDPTEGALLVLGEKAGIIKNEIENKQKRIGEIQFDSEKKYMITFNQHDKINFLNIKGAPEKIIELCDYILINGKKEKLDKKTKENILNENKKMASFALRVIGFAYKENVTISESELKGLTFIGLTAMIDPIREEAKNAIKDCKSAGINVVMITGDHKNTANEIAKQLGLIEKDSIILLGDELDKLSDKEFESIVEKVVVYARTSSIHKTRIVEMLKKKGHVVAMTGDGINDALAIKKADVGIAMGISGTEVTKEASDVVLEDDNFNTIIEAVKEGRGAYKNITKVINYLIGTNLSEVIILGFILISGLFFSGGLPIIIIPIQILWINLVTDGLCVVTLGMEKMEEEIIKEKPKKTNEPLLTKDVIKFILVTGTIIAFGTIMTFIIDYYILNNSLIHAKTMAFVVLVFYQLFSALNARSNKPIYKIGLFSNMKLIYSIVLSVLLMIIVIHIPIMNILLQTIPLSLEDWLIIIGISSTLFFIFEIKKLISYRLE